MTETHPAAGDIVFSVARSIFSRYRNFVEREDVVQECWSWYYSRAEHFNQLLSEESTVQRVINEKRMAWQMKRHAERYARREKATRSGYKLTDEAFYDTVVIAQLLPHVIASVVDNTVLEQAQNLINDGQPKKQSAPAEGGNLLATLIDIKKAYLKLDVVDKDILIKRYHENLTLQELATYLECATSTADRRCQNSLRRLQNNLGGESPYQ
ncbi:MAG: sigma-70 family RNA polymerase sigma factor [Cytophagia bacterium]|jgi:RNA polymerase sigma factor (sigma-70 family)|nr:sigma-70 family RNA polymerase sigma factor [Cytophagia bacterium]